MKVIVEIAGGVAQNVVHTPGIEVVVIDHDNLEEANHYPDDEYRLIMAETPELPWGTPGYDYHPVLRGER